MRANASLVTGILALVLLAGCSKQGAEDRTAQAPSPAAPPTTVPAVSPVAVAAPPAAAAAPPTPAPELDLAKRSGCLACHSIEKKVVGPAWNDVSKRYADDATAKSKLLEKVKKGGKGNWLEVTGGATMPPYSPRVSDEDIETLVDFVLGLQGKS